MRQTWRNDHGIAETTRQVGERLQARRLNAIVVRKQELHQCSGRLGTGCSKAVVASRIAKPAMCAYGGCAARQRWTGGEKAPAGLSKQARRRRANAYGRDKDMAGESKAGAAPGATFRRCFASNVDTASCVLRRSGPNTARRRVALLLLYIVNARAKSGGVPCSALLRGSCRYTLPLSAPAPFTRHPEKLCHPTN